MPRRKRKRTRINPLPVLLLGILAVTVFGVFYSSITSLSRVAVVGARLADQPAIEATMSVLNGIPWARVNPRWVETRVQRIPAVDHANYSQNIFGRGRLEVIYRVPVAKVKGNGMIGMDAGGVVFETSELPADLPVLIRPRSARVLTVSLGAGFPYGKVAELAVKAKALSPKEKLLIWFNDEGSLCLNMGAGVVVLGSCDDLDQKLDALKEILDQQPDLLGKVESLNLTEPSHPTKTYKR